MRPATIRPRVQLFVCTNVRGAGESLTSGCGANGPALYEALKASIARAGRIHDVWVTRTACMGHCPPRGCSVAIAPGNEQWTDANESDAPALLDRALGTITMERP